MFEIQIVEETIDQELVKTVNARDLHAGLGVGRDYHHWIKARIEKYDFMQGIDFITAKNNNRTEYHLSLDMAKELSMVEKTAKGKEARRYFIKMEKQALVKLPLATNEQLILELAKANLVVHQRLDLKADRSEVDALKAKVSDIEKPKTKTKSEHCGKGWYTIGNMVQSLIESKHPIARSALVKILKYYEDEIRKRGNCYRRDDVKVILKDIIDNAEQISPQRVLDPISEIAFKADWLN